VTVIQAGPCHVTRLRTKEKDGYCAIQMGFGDVKEKRLPRPVSGQFKKSGTRAARILREFRIEDSASYQLGQEIKVSIFEAGEFVDIAGTSKGKGFAGGMKRWGFHGGPSSHGSMIHRQPASSGSTDAARTLKGTRKPGRLGGKRSTVQGIEVVKVDALRNLLLVKGAVPGRSNSLVLVSQSVKRKKKKSPESQPARGAQAASKK
jgi:large subunit ribosomal protein L3